MKSIFVAIIVTIFIFTGVRAYENVFNANFNSSQQNLAVTEENMMSSGNISIDRGNRDFNIATQKFHILSPIFNIIDKLSASNTSIVTMNATGIEIKNNNVNTQLFKIITDNDNLKFNSNVNIQVKGTDLKYDGAKIEAGKVFFENNVVTFNGINPTAGSVDFNFDALTLNSLPININSSELTLNNLYSSQKILSEKNDPSDPISNHILSAATKTWWDERNYVKPGVSQDINVNEPVLNQGVLTWDKITSFPDRILGSGTTTEDYYITNSSHTHAVTYQIIAEVCSSDNCNLDDLICPEAGSGKWKMVYGIANRTTHNCTSPTSVDCLNDKSGVSVSAIAATLASAVYPPLIIAALATPDFEEDLGFFKIARGGEKFDIFSSDANGYNEDRASGWILCASSTAVGG